MKWCCLGVIAALYLVVVVTVMLPSEDGTPRGILKGWGDVAYHLDIIETLAANGLFRLEQPIAGGTPLTYPFFIDWVSAALRKLGLPMVAAFHIPAIAFAITLVAAFWLLGKRVLRRDILAVAFVAILLFGGGLGFWQFFKDAAEGAPFSHEYTHLDDRTGGKLPGMDAPYNIVWITPAISFFSHQRSFIPGAALGALLFWGMVRRQWAWIAAVGFLPLLHAHTFLAFAMILPVILLFHAREWRRWLPWVFAALGIALPQVLFLLRGGSEGAFFQWWPGWMARDRENVLWFWTKNFGAVFWGWVIMGVWRGAQRLSAPASAHSSDGRRLLLGAVIRRLRASIAAAPSSTAPPQLLQDAARPSFSLLMVASLVLFSAANVVKFQPWEFDNNKVLFWWWLLAAAISLLGIGTLLEKRRRWGMGVLAAFVFLATFAGFLDATGRFLRLDELLFGYYGEEEIEAANWIRANTSAGEVFLTADHANVFVPMLAGRPIYLGFPGWLWTQGKDALIKERQRVIREFLGSGDPAWLCADGVRYAVWDWQFRASYPEADARLIARAADSVFRQDAPAGVREIFKLTCP